MPGSSVRALAAILLGRKRLVAACLLFLAFGRPPALAAEKPDCEVAGLALWGDGKHDDTKALNAWFKGGRVVWAQTGRAIGPEIIGHDFLLSSTVFVPSGTDRRFERFQMIWPARKERISGGTILTGNDPDKPAIASWDRQDRRRSGRGRAVCGAGAQAGYPGCAGELSGVVTPRSIRPRAPPRPPAPLPARRAASAAATSCPPIRRTMA